MVPVGVIVGMLDHGAVFQHMHMRVFFFTHRFFLRFSGIFCAIQISVNVNRWRMPEVSMSKTRDPSASTVFSYFKFLSGNF